MTLLDSRPKERIAGDLFSVTRYMLTALVIATIVASKPSMGDELEPTVYHVEIKGFTFSPPRIAIHVGDTIEFTNRDFAPHTVTEDGATWDTGALKNGMSGRIAFDKIGTVTYHCAYHPQLKGIIMTLPGGEERH